MRSMPRVALLVAALALPVGAVLGSYALGHPDPPHLPQQVRIGEAAGHVAPGAPAVPPPAGQLPGEPPGPPGDETGKGVLPPPPPLDDDDDHDDPADHDRRDNDGNGGDDD